MFGCHSARHKFEFHFIQLKELKPIQLHINICNKILPCKNKKLYSTLLNIPLLASNPHNINIHMEVRQTKTNSSGYYYAQSSHHWEYRIWPDSHTPCQESNMELCGSNNLMCVMIQILSEKYWSESSGVGGGWRVKVASEVGLQKSVPPYMGSWVSGKWLEGGRREVCLVGSRFGVWGLSRGVYEAPLQVLQIPCYSSLHPTTILKITFIFPFVLKKLKNAF